MLGYLAEFARRRSWAAMRRCGEAHTPRAKTRHLRRAAFWSDMQELADGLATFGEISERRRRRAVYRDDDVSTSAVIVVLGGLIALFFLATGMSIALTLAAKAEEADPYAHADPARKAFFKGLKQPGNDISCCDISDCKRTEAEWRHGQWWARVPGGESGKWTAIPPEKVLDKTKSIDGDAYVCSTGPYAGGTSYLSGVGKLVTTPAMPATIYCFVKPDLGS